MPNTREVVVVASKLFKGYCPFCDQGFSAERQDIYYVMGNPCIECPSCGKDMIIPALDSNQNYFLEKDELNISLTNPNFFVYEEDEEDEVIADGSYQ